MKIITICGSFKFQKEMMEISEKLELSGNCVLTPIYPTKKVNDYKNEEILIFNKMHEEKIKMSDAIFVMNVGNYIGDSTKSEIEFAKALNKEILYYTDFKGSDNMDYVIRLANEKDCKELSKLKHMVWNETYRGIYSDEKIDNYDYEKNTEKFLNIISNSNIELYVVEDKGRLVGYMDCGFPYRPYKNYKQEIGLLYLLKEYQGKGIGRKLFDMASNKIKENGYKEFFVSCNKYNNGAQKFYKKMGGTIINIDEDSSDKSVPQVRFLYKIK